MKTVDFLALLLGACGLLALILWNESKTADNHRPRAAHGPGGYLDDEANQRANLSQTGIHDRQIPLSIRQQYAREKGLQAPEH